MKTQQQPSLFQEVLRASRRELFVALILSFFINILALTVPLYMLQVFSHVLSSRSMSTLLVITLIAVVAMVAYGALSNIRLRLLRCVGEEADLALGHRVQTAMISKATRSNAVRTASSLRDLTTFRTAISGQQAATLMDLPWAPIFVVVTFLLSPMLGTISIVGLLFLFALALINDRLVKKPQAAATRFAEQELQLSLASVRNAEAVEGMGMRSAVVDRWLNQHLTSLAQHGQATSLNGMFSDISKSATMVLQIALMGAGAYLVITDQLGMGAMIASVYLMNRGVGPITSAIGSWRAMTSAHAAYKRLVTLLSDQSEASTLELPAPKGRLEIQNVTFARPGAPPILRGVSFAGGPGEIIGIVGPSAAGKSTLLKLIVGIWRPNAGTVRLDGADVALWNPDQLGRYVGYLPQEVELFSGTVHENIARFTDAEDAEIIAAAQLAGVHELILRLAEGYETEIGDSGSILSGGQRQRIALARAFFRQPRLIVLDEPNAALDGAGEEALVAGLERAKSMGATIILVTHKPSLLFIADKIAVFRDGCLDGFGPRNDILPKIFQQPRRLAAEAKEGLGGKRIGKERPGDEDSKASTGAG